MICFNIFEKRNMNQQPKAKDMTQILVVCGAHDEPKK